MIITKLIGGLGNQMFQYATAKALALKHGVDVKVDTSELEKDSGGVYTQRKFELDCFSGNIQIANKEDLAPFKKKQDSSLSRFLQRTVPNLFSTLYAKEKGSAFNPAFLDFPQNTYLDGFWQSEIYFKAYEEEIKADLDFKQEIKDRNKELAAKIQSANSLSLHVRRGDYVSNVLTNKFHGLCTPTYYQSAVKQVMEKGNIELFIFSDDLEWCKQHSKFDLPTHFIETNNAYNDMYLMSLCKHNIIANSSFSWWGAWLNNNPDKMVIAPKKWFNDSSVDTSNIIPIEWIQL